ncbi:MAG: hypothetical protein H0X63_12305 [Flavobacteriales bacterium]|nr:hypothetical protein [Flavobacteriales bacterium]
MKKILLIGIILMLVGCDLSTCVDYTIKNAINTDIEIKSYDNTLNEIRTINIAALKNYSELSICEMGLNSITYAPYDSIQILLNGVVRKTYYPDDDGKSIYKIKDPESWHIIKNEKKHKKYEFIITNEDLD